MASIERSEAKAGILVGTKENLDLHGPIVTSCVTCHPHGEASSSTSPCPAANCKIRELYRSASVVSSWLVQLGSTEALHAAFESTRT